MSGSGRAIKVKEDEKKRIAAAQTKVFGHTSESAYMGDEVEDCGQTPLLPPTYSHSDSHSDAAAGKTYISPKAKNFFSTDTKDNLNGAYEPPHLNTTSPDPEKSNRRRQWSKCFSNNRRKAAQHILKLMTILVSLGFLVHALKGIHHRNKPEFQFRHMASHIGCSARQTCPGSTYKNSAIYEFQNPSEFSLTQRVQGGSSYSLNPSDYVRTEGEIHVRPATEHLDTNLRVEMTVHATHPELIHPESLEQTDSSLVIETLNYIRGARDFSRDKPCIYIDVTIFVAPGTTLQNLGIDTQSLAITFHPDLDYTVKDSTTLLTTSTPIRMPLGSSKLLTTTRTREIIIHSSSGSVTGAYPLYDLLSITTLSGSIDISYFPKNSSTLNPKPALLVLDTGSASIHVTSPPTSSNPLIPNRDYQNELKSGSGSISATLLHSSQTSIHAASGRIDASIHPYGSLTTPSHLSTDTKSGSATVTVHNSLSDPSSPMRAFSASHHYISGSLKLFYPSQWQGSIYGDTVSGSLNIYWDGVKVIKDNNKWSGGRSIEAERGEGGKARLEFGGVSGSSVLNGESGGLGGIEL